LYYIIHANGFYRPTCGAVIAPDRSTFSGAVDIKKHENQVDDQEHAFLRPKSLSLTKRRAGINEDRRAKTTPDFG
jgi:hypothetical protein